MNTPSVETEDFQCDGKCVEEGTLDKQEVLKCKYGISTCGFIDPANHAVLLDAVL